MALRLIGNPVVAWRDERTLQIGWGAHSLQVEHAPASLPKWLRMIDAGRDRSWLLAAAVDCGLESEQAERILLDLRRVGLLESPPPVQVAVHGAGLIDEPLCAALRQAGVLVAAGAHVTVFPQGQLPSLLAAPAGYRRLVPVWFGARAVHVGPVIDDRCGPCPRCVDLTWADADPSWWPMAAQAGSVPVWHEPAQLALAAGAIAHIAAAPQTVGLEMIFDPDRPGPAWRVWRAHPRCGCQHPDMTNGGSR